MAEVKKVTLVLENQQITEIAEMKTMLLKRVPKGFTISQTEIVKQAIDYYYKNLKKREAELEKGEKNDSNGINFG